MNENERTPRPEAPVTDEEIGELIRSSGRRSAIPDDDLAALREAGRSAWRKMAAEQRRKRFRRRGAYALAASLLIAAVGAWWLLSDRAPAAPREIATVELSSGRVELPGNSLSAGAILETAEGRLALRWALGQSVRLDSGSRLRIVSLSRLELEHGAVYVDSGPSAPGDEGLEILTPLGLVREIGTQYEVRLDDETGAVRVRVREGSISVESDGDSQTASPGEELTLHGDGPVERAAVEPSGPDWLWVLETAPSLDIEGRSLASFLDWVSRETGREIRYVDEELARSAATILLFGTIEGLRPDESIDVILQGSGLDHREQDGALLVYRP